MVYDAARARVVLYGVEERDMWARAGYGQWSRIGIGGSPVHPFSVEFLAIVLRPGARTDGHEHAERLGGLNETGS